METDDPLANYARDIFEHRNQRRHIFERKDSPCMNDFNASTQFIKFKFDQVDTVTQSIYIFHNYEVNHFFFFFFDKIQSTSLVRSEHCSIAHAYNINEL